MPRRRRRCPILRIPKVGGDNGNGSRTKARKRCNVGRTNRKNAHPFYSSKVLREVDAEGQAAIEGDNVQVLLDHNLIGETEKLRKIPKTMAERHAVALLRLQKGFLTPMTIMDHPTQSLAQRVNCSKRKCTLRQRFDTSRKKMR